MAHKTITMNYKPAKPFLKWAGGKSQLLGSIVDSLPKGLSNRQFTYVEPFVGSGAVFFAMMNRFPNLSHAVINDINPDLVNAYRVIASSSNEIISLLKQFQMEYHELEHSHDKKEEYYYTRREAFNTRNQDAVTQAALLIFLNRTCFNGLYRVNRNNAYNVPMGSYKMPTICDEENLKSVSSALQKVEILNVDFEETLNYAEADSLFYFDPPYKPLNNTSSFNSYAKESFGDAEQIRLRDYCSKLDKLGHSWILSNSDVRGADPENHFFDVLYGSFHIQRVRARRSINSKAEKRGELNELLITNYVLPTTFN